MEVMENIKKYGNKDKNYVPYEYATCYPLHSQDFVRTGFQDISYTLASRDYKDPKCVIVKRSEEMEYKTIVAMRGRNPENPSDRTVGAPTEQRLEPNSQGICNTLTSVQKENLVMERASFCIGGLQEHQTPRTDGISPSLTAAMGMGGGQTPLINEIQRVGRISNDGSQYGTVISENGISANLVAGTHGYANNCIQTKYRIRKLTPLECWRLMDFKDEDFHKAAEVNSNTQLYRQSGNSIVKAVLMAIFSQLGINGVPKWNDLSVEERCNLIGGNKKYHS